MLVTLGANRVKDSLKAALDTVLLNAPDLKFAMEVLHDLDFALIFIGKSH